MKNNFNSNSIAFIGTDFREGKGGVASVLKSYKKIFPAAVFISTTKSTGFLTNFFVLLKGVFCFFCKVAFNQGIKIVHIHGASYNSFWRKSIFVLFARLFGKKVIFHIHGGEFHLFYNRAPLMVRCILLKCNMIIALSEHWKEFFEDVVGHPQVVVVNNVVDRPENLIVEKDTVIHFSFLGFLGEAKGIYDLLKIIQKNSSKLNNHALFHLAGNGEVEKIQEIIQENSLSNLVRLEGYISGNKKIELLNKTDVYVLPSYNEGLPISILEAMSYSLPIISTSVGGIPEILKNGKNGFLINPGKPEELEDSIFRLIEDKELRTSMGEESRKIVEDYFPEAVEAQLLNIYAQLINV